MAKQVMDLEAQLATMRATVVTLLGQMGALQAQVARADTMQEQERESVQEQARDINLPLRNRAKFRARNRACAKSREISRAKSREISRGANWTLH